MKLLNNTFEVFKSFSTFTKSKLAEGEILINGVNVPKRFYSHQRVYAIEDGKLVWNDELEARYGK